MFTYLVELVTRIEAEKRKDDDGITEKESENNLLRIVSSLGIKSPPLNANTGFCDTWLRGLGQ